MKYKIIRSGLVLLSFLVCIALPAFATQRPGASLPAWMVGFWKVSYNEDSMPPDIFELTADGHYVGRGMHCDAHYMGDVHLHNGEIYVRGVIPGKGPMAFLLVPDEHRNLGFTSTRTGNNAVYSKLASNPCKDR